MALFAGFMAANGDLRLCSEKRLLKLQRQIFAQIGAALHPAAPTAASAPSE
jgi:hypothetical protein